MIFLYNKERILREALALTKLTILKELGVKEDIVEVKYVVKEGNLYPDIKIEKEKIPLGKLDSIDEIIKESWIRYLDDAQQKLSRLQGEKEPS